ncbi:MAG TPA: hypothetical protein VF941_15495 [Clostridia bacterium]
MKPSKGEIVAGVITALTVATLATASFSQETKQRIREKEGGEERCAMCGRTPDDGVKITYHHKIPEFYLKKLGINPDDAEYGVMLCRTPCHDLADRQLLSLPVYANALRGHSHSHK